MDISEIKGYLDTDGKLKQLPTKRKKKILALYYIAEQIPPDGMYSEREFNQVLGGLHTFADPATLRRELYDYFLINRDPGGSGYHLSPNRPSIEELFAKYC